MLSPKAPTYEPNIADVLAAASVGASLEPAVVVLSLAVAFAVELLSGAPNLTVQPEMPTTKRSSRNCVLMANGLLKFRSIFNAGNALNAAVLLGLAFFTFLMARITVAYIPYNTDVGFLRIKQSYIDIDHWRIAFFVHVYMSMWVLLAGFTQFSAAIRDRYTRLHRIFGYIYVADVVLVTGPAGLLMGIYANGGITSKVSFVMLAALWIAFTATALARARGGDLAAHRDWMIRSYALTLSAITLRAWKWSITNSFELPPMDVYRAVAWLGWVPNLIVAELIIRQYRLRHYRRGNTSTA